MEIFLKKLLHFSKKCDIMYAMCEKSYFGIYSGRNIK